ncbi:MAG: Fe-S cluster assembly sulfur transfer protein SufU [Chloroflexota bacterium]
MDDLYRDYILDHYRRPRNHGRLEHADISHEEDNPLCGDRIHLDLRIDEGIVADVRFDGHGCAISQASASVLTEMIKGRPLAELRDLGQGDILENLGIDTISPARLKCATLSLRVLRKGAFGLSQLPGEDDEDGASPSRGEEEEGIWPPR